MMAGKHSQTWTPEDQVHHTSAESTVGPVTVAWSAKGVCAVLLGCSEVERERRLTEMLAPARIAPSPPHADWIDEVVLSIDSQQPGPPDAPRDIHDFAAVPLDLRGTSFQLAVWHALLGVAPGNTVSYSELAASIGRPRAVRAVAAACGANPVAIIVPCHRVIGADGSLRGYRWGLDKKRELLRREREAATRST